MNLRLLHVAADSKNPGVVGPIFPDGRFEFIPIDEETSRVRQTYADLPARNRQYGSTLAHFLPSNLARAIPHSDPDFTSCTYGEPDISEEVRPRAMRRLDKGDILFFVCSLAPYNPAAYQARDTRLVTFQRYKKNKYLMGFFTIRGVAQVSATGSAIRKVTPIAGSIPVPVIKANQHFKRLSPKERDEFIVVAGDPSRSALLTHAVPLTDRSEGSSFRLSRLGRTILNRERDTLRGTRPIDGKFGITVAQAIAAANPEQTFDLRPLFPATNRCRSG